MGAEGSIVVMPRWQWDEHVGDDTPPHDFGFYTGTILGQEAVWTYHGENTGYETSPEMCADNDAGRAVVNWFLSKAETHEVWT